MPGIDAKLAWTRTHVTVLEGLEGGFAPVANSRGSATVCHTARGRLKKIPRIAERLYQAYEVKSYPGEDALQLEKI